MAPLTVLEVDALTRPVFDAIEGYRLSHRARDRGRLTESSFIYGETLLEPFFELVSSVPRAPGDVFLDLGSGVGRAVAFAALLFDFAEVRGHELLPDLFEASEAALRDLTAGVASDSAREALSRVRLQPTSLLEADFGSANVVYVMTAVFEERLLEMLKERLQTLPFGATVLAVGAALEVSGLKLERGTPFETGWGASQAYVYRVVSGG